MSSSVRPVAAITGETPLSIAPCGDVDRDRIDRAVDDDVHADGIERFERIVDARLAAAPDVVGQPVPAEVALERGNQVEGRPPHRLQRTPRARAGRARRQRRRAPN